MASEKAPCALLNELVTKRFNTTPQFSATDDVAERGFRATVTISTPEGPRTFESSGAFGSKAKAKDCAAVTALSFLGQDEGLAPPEERERTRAEETESKAALLNRLCQKLFKAAPAFVEEPSEGGFIGRVTVPSAEPLTFESAGSFGSKRKARESAAAKALARLETEGTPTVSQPPQDIGPVGALPPQDMGPVGALPPQEGQPTSTKLLNDKCQKMFGVNPSYFETEEAGRFSSRLEFRTPEGTLAYSSDGSFQSKRLAKLSAAANALEALETMGPNAMTQPPSSQMESSHLAMRTGNSTNENTFAQSLSLPADVTVTELSSSLNLNSNVDDYLEGTDVKASLSIIHDTSDDFKKGGGAEDSMTATSEPLMLESDRFAIGEKRAGELSTNPCQHHEMGLNESAESRNKSFATYPEQRSYKIESSPLMNSTEAKVEYPKDGNEKISPEIHPEPTEVSVIESSYSLEVQVEGLEVRAPLSLSSDRSDDVSGVVPEVADHEQQLMSTTPFQRTLSHGMGPGESDSSFESLVEHSDRGLYEADKSPFPDANATIRGEEETSSDALSVSTDAMIPEACSSPKLTSRMNAAVEGTDVKASLPVSCANCNKAIGINGTKDFFFFERKEKDVHFVLDAKLTPIYKVKQFLIFKEGEEGEDNQIQCVACQEKLGKYSPLGPSGSRCVSFGASKVRISGVVLKKKERWWQRENFPHLKLIEVRNSDSYSGYHEGRHKEALRNRNYGTLDLNFIQDDGNFEVSDLLISRKNPKREQFLAFVRGLIRNTIIILPTGFGKTFIASLIMKRIHMKNPLRTAVMLVDRIPLVQQQARAISQDTGMVITFCNSTGIKSNR